jgi:hypothetical protein
MYTILFYYILPLIVLLKIINYLRVSNESLRVKYHFEELHSRLLSLAIANKAYATDQRFLFLDKSLRSAPLSLRRLNLWVILYRLLKDRKKNRYSLSQIEKNIIHDQNLRAIYREYTITSVNFFQSKSRYSLYLFTLLLKIYGIISLSRTGGKRIFSILNLKLKYVLVSDGAVASA